MINKNLILLGITIFLSALLHASNDNLLRVNEKALNKLKNETKQRVEKGLRTNKILKWGMDLSHHQSSINWEILVKKNKPDFIFFKSTEGSTHTDSKYAEYSSKARSLGIKVGAYHFFSYQSKGIAQAKNFIKTSKLKKGDIIPVLDVEFKKGIPIKDTLLKEIQGFCDEIKKKYGVNPIIYCEYDYYNKYLKTQFKDYKYWISDFYRDPKCEWVIWQYTDQAIICGIQGNLDKNLLNAKIDINDLIIN